MAPDYIPSVDWIFLVSSRCRWVLLLFHRAPENSRCTDKDPDGKIKGIHRPPPSPGSKIHFQFHVCNRLMRSEEGCATLFHVVCLAYAEQNWNNMFPEKRKKSLPYLFRLTAPTLRFQRKFFFLAFVHFLHKLFPLFTITIPLSQDCYFAIDGRLGVVKSDEKMFIPKCLPNGNSH